MVPLYGAAGCAETGLGWGQYTSSAKYFFRLACGTEGVMAVQLTDFLGGCGGTVGGLSGSCEGFDAGWKCSTCGGFGGLWMSAVGPIGGWVGSSSVGGSMVIAAGGECDDSTALFGDEWVWDGSAVVIDAVGGDGPERGIFRLRKTIRAPRRRL